MTAYKTFILVFIVSSVLSASVLHAQQADSVQTLQPGDHALQFQITENFDLSSFSGTLISYKYQKTRSKAARIGVSINGLIEDGEFSDPTEETDNLDLRFNLGLSYTWMHYVNPDAEIKFYYGYGPGVNIGYNKSELEDENRSSTIKRSRFGIAGIGYTGVEWFFSELMSIHAEYGASVRFIYIKSENNISNGPQRESTKKAVRFGGDGVRFGISVHF